MKPYLRILGWIFVGILLQFKFDVLYQIVRLENLSFHTRSYIIKMNLMPSDETLRVLHVETTVHYSQGADYFAYVYIPTQYKVINKTPDLRAQSIAGYQVFQMDMKRKYRDVIAATDFIIAPQTTDTEIAPIPLLIHFENLKQRLHDDKTYILSTHDKDTQLQGPAKVEVNYPQQFGL